MRSDLHIIFKNVQSIHSDQRILALDVDLNAITFDICCVAESWTREDEVHFSTPGNHSLYLSGGAPDGHKGVGIIINSKILKDISDIAFSAIHCRLCFL